MNKRMNNLICVSQKVPRWKDSSPSSFPPVARPPAALIVVPRHLQTWELLKTCYFFGTGTG